MNCKPGYLTREISNAAGNHLRNRNEFILNLIKLRMAKLDMIWILVAIFLLADLGSCLPSARQSPGDSEITSYRLPGDLKAYLYELQLRTFVGDFSDNPKYKTKSFKFDGKLGFTFRCRNATSRIVLHSRDLIIDKDSVQLVRYANSDDDAYENKKLGASEPVTLDKEWALDNKRDFVIFYFDKKTNAKCSKGSYYKISLSYSGDILEKPYGLFRNSFVDKNGKLNHLAATQFASLDARRMFPCLDEPAERAEFDVSIVRPKYLNSQSNMPLTRTEPYAADPDWEVDYFERSLKMSTYLLAVLVSNFKKVTQYTDKYKVLVEITARPDAIDANQTSYALNDAVKVIDFYSDYFNITYPLKKSTHGGLPDFITGAMENWGFIISKEIWLVVDPARDSIDRVKKVTSVLCHELAHQWFGDLVTMNWWNELWLNEGFASWIKYLGFNKTHPEWEMLDYFFIQSLNPMKLDSYESSRPVTFKESDISTPNEVNSVFDPISYYKPGSLLRMLNEYLGYETFRKALSTYLKKYAYGNTRQDDLFAEIDKQAHLDNALSPDLNMKAIMDSWTLKMGYPVVNLTKTLRTSDSSYQICMTQEWFLINPLNKQDKSSKQFKEYKWYIPVNYMLKSDKTSANSNKNIHWLRPEVDKYCFDLKPTGVDQASLSQNWILANLKFMGFFRINYDTDNWNLLIKQINEDPKQIERISRAQLIDDAFYLGKGEYIDQLIFFRMIDFLRANESEYMPYITALEGLNYIRAMLANDYLGSKAFKNFIRKFLRPTYNRLYWNTSIVDTNDIALQMATLELMCLSDDEDCIKVANVYYDSWINLKTNLPNNFQNIVLKTRVKYGSEKDWFDILEVAKKTNTLTAKLNYLSMLAFTRDINLVKLLLNYSTDPDILPAQSQNEVILVLGQNPWSRTVLYDYMVENWELLLKKYDNLPFTLRDLVRAVMANVNTRYEYARLKEFVAKNTNNLGVAAAEFKLSYEIIETNTRWMDVNYVKVRDYLAKY